MELIDKLQEQLWGRRTLRHADQFQIHRTPLPPEPQPPRVCLTETRFQFNLSCLDYYMLNDDIGENEKNPSHTTYFQQQLIIKLAT